MQVICQTLVGLQDLEVAAVKNLISLQNDWLFKSLS